MWIINNHTPCFFYVSNILEPLSRACIFSSKNSVSVLIASVTFIRCLILSKSKYFVPFLRHLYFTIFLILVHIIMWFKFGFTSEWMEETHTGLTGLLDFKTIFSRPSLLFGRKNIESDYFVVYLKNFPAFLIL